MTQELIITLTIAILLIPLASFTLLIFFGKRLPRGGDAIATTLLFSVLAMSLVVMVTKLVSFPNEVIQLSFKWITFGNVPFIGPLDITLGMMIDNLSAIMVVVVAIVSSLVHLFSIGYMKDDIRYSRYFAFLGFFTFSMLIIVITNNLFTMYVGWELVGISSYLLIGHWYEKKTASDAAIKAFIVNRVGDLGMFAGVMIIFFTFRTFSFDAIFNAIAGGTIPMGSETWLTVAGVLMFCGAIGKSAQFPLHVWLPDAMEGPTPVSAFIHAATMVAAGVYLIARVFVMFTADALVFIAYIGAITAFIAATIAIAQNDIKKVLAYSTISQLGYMILGLGVGAYTAGFFHLVTHAMFKAGLFLGSGSVIYGIHHAMHHLHDHDTDPQDIRNMGGLRKKMPITFWTFLIYTLAISGVPLTSGFLSKDSILAGTMAFGGLTGHYFIPIVGFLVAGLTAFYMFRLVILTFLGEHKDHHRFNHIHDSPAVMTIPLIVFAILSFFGFYSFNPIDAASGWIYKVLPRPESVVPFAIQAASIETFGEAVHQAHYPAMALSLIVAGLGILIAFLTYYWKKINADTVALRLAPVHKFLLNKWYFDDLYNGVIVGGTHAFTRIIKWFDDNIIDGFVNNVASWTVAGTLGYKEQWKTRTLSSTTYLTVSLFVAVAVGYFSTSALWPDSTGFINYIGAILGGVLAGSLTLFGFWSGAGGFDKYVVDGLVNGVAYTSGFFGLVFRKIQTGRVQTYIIFALFGFMILYFIFRTFYVL
ncbi:MAG: NADH-quinone oxidoreductase subunit L [Bacteroidetes bacterium]|nr:NADH-quinone oxidoreductase subunit L [Bacteroidota bacterium]